MTLLAVIAPETTRNILILVIGGCYLGYHLFHVWRQRHEKTRDDAGETEKVVTEKVEKQDVETKDEEKRDAEKRNEEKKDIERKDAEKKDEEKKADVGEQSRDDGVREERVIPPTVQQPQPQPSSPPPSPISPSLSGEELYVQARAMPHRKVPDIKHDGAYLKMLVESAELGYPKAAAKLGDYAMRRGWTVEAYYWLWQAKRAGMKNLNRTLLQVRSAWANGGFRRESSNEHACFSREQGTIGYSLLCIDARHNADAAKARLAECAPDFILSAASKRTDSP